MQLMLMIPLWRFFSAPAQPCNREARRSRSWSISIPPAPTARVIVESITADKDGRLYLPDRVTGNILRVDPKTPKPVVVGRIEAREITGKKVNADGSRNRFQSAGRSFYTPRALQRSRARQGI